MRLFWHELRMQQLLFWRNRESAVFVFILPPLLFLLLVSLYGGHIDAFPAADVLLVSMLGYGCINTAFAGLAITLVIRREAGMLKRVRATPVTPPTYLAAVLCSTLVVFVLQLFVMMALGMALYSARGPQNWGSLALAVLLGVAAFAGLGFGAAALIRSSEGASAVVQLVVLPMAFLSGAFGPTRRYPAVLQAISDVLPLTYYIRILKHVYLLGDSIWTQPWEILAVVAWGLAGLAIAWRRFGWEPRER
jgi:ABC-2 type transport system permease protein